MEPRQAKAGDLIENSPFDLRMSLGLRASPVDHVTIGFQQAQKQAHDSGEDEKCKMLCKKPLETARAPKLRWLLRYLQS